MKFIACSYHQKSMAYIVDISDCVKFNDVFAYLKLIARWHKHIFKMCVHKSGGQKENRSTRNEWNKHKSELTSLMNHTTHTRTKTSVSFYLHPESLQMWCTLFASLSISISIWNFWLNAVITGKGFKHSNASTETKLQKCLERKNDVQYFDSIQFSKQFRIH